MVAETYFISDLHLSAERPDISRALTRFLDRHCDCERLFILGDLFEAWVGDDDDSPIALDTAELLRAFAASGPELLLMQGNRDFLLGEDFCATIGARLLPDPSVIELYGETVLLMHGDSLCTGDEEYQAFRRTARDPAWQAELLARSLEERRTLAAQLRGMSKEANSNKAEDIMDVTADEVTRVMRDHGVRQLIHGHTHRPAKHQIASGLRWVLGDWDKLGWTIRASAQGIELESFDI